MRCMNVYDELRKAGTKGEFDQMVNDFCEALRAELTRMDFKFEEHPDENFRGGEKAINDKECQLTGLYCDINALRLKKDDRRYGKWLREKDFADLIDFKNQLPNV
jgi:hypothetical protein